MHPFVTCYPDANLLYIRSPIYWFNPPITPNNVVWMTEEASRRMSESGSKL